MGRNKAKDDLYFNCSQSHEFDYVAGLYGNNSEKVKAFLNESCSSGVIRYSTHSEVYHLIKSKFGYDIPV